MNSHEKTARLHRMLRTRHLGSKGRNGAGYAYFTEVPLATGYQHKQRFADAIAMSLYPSRGLDLHGFEIKVSRSDWLKELREPEKADGFVRYCDHWWLVAEPDVIEDDELPPTWGLLVRRGNKLVAKVKAPRLQVQPYSRDFLSGLLRAATVEQTIKPEQILDAEIAAREAADTRWEGQLERERERNQRLQKRIDDFEQASGIKLKNSFPVQYDSLEVGKAVKLVLEGKEKVAQLERRLQRVTEEATKLAGDANRMLPKRSKKQ